ncbi:YdeI/OmpD-associated family protein [Sphingosinicella sp.]|uniref:YdeI/OmpD-associated family protein n=1 Tax=Sphingosinicella sp. TaxID=1917971 RepID=UPI004037BF94
MKTDPRVDAYIAKQADFARPILTHLRDMLHEACPDCEETLKWSMPSFLYQGKILAGFAAFKAHATFGYWNDSMLQQEEKNRSAMGQFGRLTSLDDLPDRDRLIALTRDSMALIDSGAKPPRATAKKAPFTVPQDMQAAIGANSAARATFDGFPPSAQREYVEWVTEAKSDATRGKRLAQSVEWLAEGKRRHWKYANC